MERKRLFVALATVSLLFAAASAYAQCPVVGGSPQSEQYAANRVRLRYLPTGPGSGDDMPQLFKSLFTASLGTFDPVNTHSVHVRFLLNGNQAQVMWDNTIPPNANWTQTGNRWDYNDPLVTYGVRRARVIDLGGGMYLIVRYLGRNQNISFAPILPGTDNVTAEVEVYDGSNIGVCYGGSTDVCAGGGNTQTCKVVF